jgi:hypothetical protein
LSELFLPKAARTPHLVSITKTKEIETQNVWMETMAILSVISTNTSPGPKRASDDQKRIYIALVDEDPTINGLDLPLGSIVMWNDGGEGKKYFKTGDATTDWTRDTLEGDTDLSSIPFTPTTPADWSTVPTTIQGGLDTLAGDVAISGTLEETLAIGNTTGGSDIVLSSGDAITSANLSLTENAITGTNIVLTPSTNGIQIDTGGNARGANSLDIQANRTVDTQVASGPNSVVIGANNTASGNRSAAIGTTNNVSGDYSGAFGGFENTISGYYSGTAGGFRNTVSGDMNFVGGRDNTVSGSYNLVGGRGHPSISGPGNLVTGRQHTVTASYSVVAGGPDGLPIYGNTVAGTSSLVMGERNSIAAGVNVKYNTLIGYQNSVTPTTTAAKYNLLVGEGHSVSANSDYNTFFCRGNTTTDASGYCFAHGGGNTLADFSKVFGYNNTITSGFYSFAIGYANSVAAGSYNFLHGVSNAATGTGSEYNFISGVSNTLQKDPGGVRYGEHCAVFGSSNTVQGPYNVVGGQSHSVGFGHSAVFGQGHTVGTTASSDHSLVVGNNNSVQSAPGMIVAGANHVVSGSAYFGAVFGTNNASTQGEQFLGGYNNTANGRVAFIHGEDNTADGDNSVVFGDTNIAAGDYSFTHGTRSNNAGNWSISVGEYHDVDGRWVGCFGYQNVVGGAGDGDFGFAAGGWNNITRPFATATGYGNDVYSAYGIAMGQKNTIAGPSSADSIALGDNNTINNNSPSSVAIGGDNTISTGAFQTVALGTFNTVSSFYSSAIGRGNTCGAAAYYSFAGGLNNNTYGPGTVALGSTNATTGSYSVALGRANTTSADYGMATGWESVARTTYQFTRAGGHFGGVGETDGNMQWSIYLAAKATTNNTTTSLAPEIVVPAKMTLGFRIMLVAREVTAAGSTDSAMWEGIGFIRRDNAGNTTLVSTSNLSKVESDAGAAAWTAVVAADDTAETLEINVTGENLKTIRWHATIWTNEAGSTAA